jgi:hypothetical protein
VAVAALLVAAPVTVNAFDLSTYASASKLNSGTWVKVAITESGMHCITESQLRSWGFGTPANVKVYGYGAERLPDQLTSGYLDDLPQTASEYVAGKGLFFYAVGPQTWSESATGFFVPAQHPWSSTGYYFLSDSTDDERLDPISVAYSSTSTTDLATTFYDRLFHEENTTSPGEAGFFLVGEDFRYTNTRTFQFQLTDKADGPVRMETTFVAWSTSGGSNLYFTVNGATLPSLSTDNISKVTDSYSYGNMSTSRREFSVSGTNLNVGIGFHSSYSMLAANLDYIAINYPRQLTLPSSKQLTFYLTTSDLGASLSGAGTDTRVWNVTDPHSIISVNATASNSTLAWRDGGGAARTYVAWEPGGTLLKPTYVETVANQNLHGLANADMVIFTPTEWKAQAERLAEHHRTVDTMNVLVLTPQEVYNEFSSGTPDAQAFRKLLKMMYDRSVGDAHQLSYSIFFSRPTYDFQCLTTKVKALNYPMLPAWFTAKGLNDNDSYMTDDVFGFLDDNSGANFGRDKLRIAVGRLPATSVSDAKAMVDKLLSYMTTPPSGSWKNTVMITADDENKAIHAIDAEKMWNNMMGGTAGNEAIYKKVYIDAYSLVSNVCEDGRTEFYHNLDEGVMWWTYQGHANTSSLTAEGLVTYRDINAFYSRRCPVLYAATCDFMRWDSATLSGAEILFRTSNGGIIAGISATRPVYISENGYLSESFGNELFTRNADGSIRTVGQVYQWAKNNYRKTENYPSNTNKLRYVLMGDPAMRLAMPSNIIAVDEVAGTPVVDLDDAENPATLMARQQTTITGRITDPSGALLSDFNGTVSATLYDADESVTTEGRGDGDDGVSITFDTMGGKLFVGSGAVKNGEFTLTVTMPAEVSNNYRPATLNLYAEADNNAEAVGVCRNLYVYGVDPDAVEDTEAPVIEAMYLNHESFKNGQDVNASPTLMATVTDNRAINISTAGIGHQMALYLDDGAKSYSDVSLYYTPNADGSPGGTIAYPLEGLATGNHTLRLRVWDTAPNSAEASIDFNVASEIAPQIFEVYTDKNPVSTEANFYVSHDRPDGTLTVTIEVFDLMGRKLWTSTETNRSDLTTSHPITWDLCDSGGRRVVRGIYVYRATVTDDESGEKSSTKSKKLAVTGGD